MSSTGLVAGRYTVQAEFPGFDTGVLTGVRVRAGDNRQTLVLKIQRLQDSITVGQDAQDAASDRRGPAFGTALTREQIDNYAGYSGTRTSPFPGQPTLVVNPRKIDFMIGLFF